jgi:hypothetical protein
MPRPVRKRLRLKDIPGGWNVGLPGNPDAPVTVVITADAEEARSRPLASYIGAGRGLYGSPSEVDDDIRASRDEWET